MSKVVTLQDLKKKSEPRSSTTLPSYRVLELLREQREELENASYYTHALEDTVDALAVQVEDLRVENQELRGHLELESPPARLLLPVVTGRDGRADPVRSKDAFARVNARIAEALERHRRQRDQERKDAEGNSEGRR